MYKSALFIGFFLLLSPAVTFAAAPSCSAKGYTVVYVNGIFDTKPQADENKDILKGYLGDKLNNEPIMVRLGYNPTHLAGVGDVAQSAVQLFNSSISNFDLDTILLQIYPEVTTRKLMLVGHSQGAFYTNSMYSYLLAHGEPSESVAVYNVGSPATYTAGGGKYINSSGDTLLAFLRGLHFTILPNNADLMPTGQDGDYSGHSFADDYLAQGSTQMLADMGGEMNGLKATDASQTGDCFTPPSQTLGYKTEAAAFAIVDPTATVLKAGTVATVQAGEVAIAAATKLAVGALQLFADAVTIAKQPPTSAQTDAKTLEITNKLYGSSVDNLSAQDKKDLLGNSQGGAVVLAVTPAIAQTPTTTGVVLGTSTEVAAPQPANIFPMSSNGPIIGGGAGAPAPAPVVAIADTPAPEVVDAPAVDDASITVDEATTTDDTASTTPPVVDDPATTTPVIDEPATTTPPLPTGAPVVDSFDSYDGTGWAPIATWNNAFTLFGPDTGASDPFSADLTVSDCHSGNCIFATGLQGGLGTMGSESFMYKESGIPQDEGSFVFWSRQRKGWRDPNLNVYVCAGSSTSCIFPDSFAFMNVGVSDDAWHEYLIAWRQTPSAVETCLMRDDIAMTDCSWAPSQSVPAGAQFVGVAFRGSVADRGSGDQIWIDDIGNVPN